ncbi:MULTISPECIES: hypothetical protein [Mycobacterium avium complex (MAC)]|uniref:Uncharacterized protein n=1 Tax=Mycobacterium arosiense ATCC BAA-1401 = DSM 45069 TaxID=1265311 RepID=A0A1W9ZHZ4_MYCAI|nr:MULTISPECIES: hypothetical protein [Mycobacterium avium complex (MAC)]ORA15702.1 hypothetical protein BST14_11690 [Mycobacterium arosiense ATCC BAA-1401 = DSM 45069]
MTVYALDLGKVHDAIRETLVERVLPAVESQSARGELLAAVEMLDSLQARTAWDRAPLGAAAARTESLAAALGQTSEFSERAPQDGDLVALRALRAAIGQKLAMAYADGIDPSIAAAVAEFSTADIQAEISPGLRLGLPG